MKIGLVLPGNIWFSPYVKIYTQMLDKIGASYDIISWNRDGRDAKTGFQFELETDNSKSRLAKLLPYFQYISFIKKTIKREKYEKLVVFGPQMAILLSGFLAKNYKGRFIFDYRDLSIEQKTFLKRPFLSVLKNSCANVISSPGFKKCLPEGFDYLLSHNFDIEIVRKALENKQISEPQGKEINVLTIGGIRDYSSNIEVVKALANKPNFKLQFVGRGGAAELIKSYADENSIRNIEFEGFYPKEKEAGYILDSSVLNIFYPKIISHSTALSNRFYNALIYKRPMLVTANSTQGDFVAKHNLGLSLENCDGLQSKLEDYLSNLDYKAFAERCNALLDTFLEDYNKLEKTVVEFVSE